MGLGMAESSAPSLKEIIAESVANAGFEIPPIEFNVPIAELSYDEWEAIMDQYPWWVKAVVVAILAIAVLYLGLRVLKL
jgi:hypothetical protein